MGVREILANVSGVIGRVILGVRCGMFGDRGDTGDTGDSIAGCGGELWEDGGVMGALGILSLKGLYASWGFPVSLGPDDPVNISLRLLWTVARRADRSRLGPSMWACVGCSISTEYRDKLKLHRNNQRL